MWKRNGFRLNRKNAKQLNEEVETARFGGQEDPSILFEVERVNITRIYGFQIGQIYGAKSRNDFLHIYRDTLVSLVPPYICHGQSNYRYHAHHFTRLTAIGSRKDNPDSELWPQWHYFFVINRGILSGKKSQGRARDVVCRSLSRVVPVVYNSTL
ncbi:hypothetical protein OUZ56_031217 [Daphnia magna]|uniref:Uncharacterized protein n=1 Tax=Daphnia magna TaxID=35525 RepID=A0ABQ9ZTM0_9CRUS|nr:hypothetical protein OUZ56_031217 [Daphnia magna]